MSLGNRSYISSEKNTVLFPSQMTYDYQASHEFSEWAHELNLLGVSVINGLMGRKQTLVTGLGDLPGGIK